MTNQRKANSLKKQLKISLKITCNAIENVKQKWRKVKFVLGEMFQPNPSKFATKFGKI